MDRPRFVYTLYIHTTPEKLWEALTDGEFTRKYWSGYRLESDWTVGAPMKIYGPDGDLLHSDRVLKADRPKVLSYSWKSLSKDVPDEPPSTVTFEIEPMDGDVRLTVTHADFPVNSKIFPMISHGWPAVLSSLKSLLEMGKPLVFSPCRS